MPQFTPLTHEDFQRKGKAEERKVDLTLYHVFLSPLCLGEGGVIALEEGDRRRVVKRRLTIMAHQLGFGVKWRVAPEGSLRFQLVPLQPKAPATAKSATERSPTNRAGRPRKTGPTTS